MNNKIIVAVIAIIILGAALFLLSKNNSSQTSMPMQGQSQTSTTQSTQETNGQNTVTIKNFAFTPTTITVKVGDKVTWTNQDSAGHSATADDGSFDTGVLSQGKSGTITFNKVGTYTYHCSVHPMMKGTIIVK